MLLIETVRRRTVADQGDRGSTLAAVVGIVMITGVVAASLLTATVFGTGFTSASRAGVQSHAAAEAGIDYARKNLALCSAGVITSPTGTTPQFSVSLEHRGSVQGAWTAGCPPRGAVEVRLVSTGSAEARGVAGHNRGDVRRMTSVLRTKFPRAVVGDRSIDNSGSLKLPVVSGRPSDMSTNGNFRCNGALVHTGTLYVGGTYANTNCSSQGTVITGAAVDPTAAEHVFPVQHRVDRRWPTASLSMAEFAAAVGSTSTDPCNIVAARTTAVVLSDKPIFIDATTCPGGLLSLSMNVPLALLGDVVLFVDKLTAASRRTVTVQSGDGKPHVLHIVRPWPAGHGGGCPATPAADVALNGVLQSADAVAGVMLYSSSQIVSGPDSAKKFPGQIYACSLNLQGSTEVTFVPTGPLLVHAKRDVTE